MASRWLSLAWRSGWLLLLVLLSGCNCFTATDLAQYVVSDSWHSSSPFLNAKPVDGGLRRDWWKPYDDPVLNWLIEQAMAANPNLRAAAERFVQAHDVMSRDRSQYLPRVRMEFGASHNRQSFNKLLRPPDSPLQLNTAAPGAIAPMDT